MFKSQCLALAAVFGGITIFCILVGWSFIGVLAMIAATIFCLVWFAKYGRDQGIARKHQAEAIDHEPKQFPRTSPGSGRLYIPSSSDQY